MGRILLDGCCHNYDLRSRRRMGKQVIGKTESQIDKVNRLANRSVFWAKVSITFAALAVVFQVAARVLK